MTLQEVVELQFFGSTTADNRGMGNSEALHNVNNIYQTIMTLLSQNQFGFN